MNPEDSWLPPEGWKPDAEEALLAAFWEYASESETIRNLVSKVKARLDPLLDPVNAGPLSLEDMVKEITLWATVGFPDLNLPGDELKDSPEENADSQTTAIMKRLSRLVGRTPGVSGNRYKGFLDAAKELNKVTKGRNWMCLLSPDFPNKRFWQIDPLPSNVAALDWNLPDTLPSSGYLDLSQFHETQSDLVIVAASIKDGMLNCVKDPYSGDDVFEFGKREGWYPLTPGECAPSPKHISFSCIFLPHGFKATSGELFTYLSTLNMSLSNSPESLPYVKDTSGLYAFVWSEYDPGVDCELPFDAEDTSAPGLAVCFPFGNPTYYTRGIARGAIQIAKLLGCESEYETPDDAGSLNNMNANSTRNILRRLLCYRMVRWGNLEEVENVTVNVETMRDNCVPFYSRGAENTVEKKNRDQAAKADACFTKLFCLPGEKMLSKGKIFLFKY